MAAYQIKIPSCIYSGAGSIEKINEIIKKEKANSLVLFTDNGVKGAGLLELLCAELKKTGVAYETVDGIRPEPSYVEVEEIVNGISHLDADLVVAVGGGSVMDTAKLYTVLKGADYNIKELLEHPGLAMKKIKSVMIPTTCGTGSEATCNAIVAVPEKELKIGIVNDEMIPDYVILDSDMIRSLPASILASSGVDALAHAVECFTSNKATPLSDTYALAAAKLIFGSIKKAYASTEDMSAKSELLLGAFYGGVAITGSGTTAVHALSYPLGGKYHIPHGVSNAILFAPVMRYNLDACEERLAEICDAIRPDLSSLGATEKANYVVDEIADIVRFTKIPEKLIDFGVSKNDLDFLVDAASGVTRLLNNNKKEVTKEAIRSIYTELLSDD